ncbi:hypothetical protein [Altericroceibacterium endophyticum]|uniref:Uncharacterized protein n=1 Tax=Altericroceibacterium endophyticum TaxID=1808508 RepID=A0A6I4T181_9SPHN|nr:hypothetical protein [Altericroceibacterium endophyticum]MXO64686.1 hypothetical protein [Altericroceibacterium endophyticum]
MEAVVPFLLILVGWNTAAPHDSMEIQQTLMISHETCIAKGEAFLQRQKSEGAYSRGAEDFRYFCVKAPDSEDFQTMFDDIK